MPFRGQLWDFASSIPVRSMLLSCLTFYIFLTHDSPQYRWRRYFVASFLFAVPVFVGIFWQAAVAINVPEPYLDEVFHIPQAQQYCQGRWFEWDDKITTPPGLYVIGIRIFKLWTDNCSELNLRLTSWFSLLLLGVTTMQCRRLIEARLSERDTVQTRYRQLSVYAIHAGMNTGLFPLLFFFSALYYTDVLSTLVVLLAFQNHLERVSPWGRTWSSDFWVIFFGVTALFMRQTNVFWVVVFMGGLEAVHAVKTLPLPSDAQALVPPSDSGFVEKVKYYTMLCSWGFIHDPALNLVSLDDVFFFVVSAAIAVLYNPVRVLKQVWPHVFVLGLFVAFVLWNGSVVLGDKSNHVATIHLPQMLYIWPLFAFFSAPLLVPFLMLLFPLIWDTYSKSQWGDVVRKETQSKTHGDAERKAAEPQLNTEQDQSLSKFQELYLTYGRNLNIAGYALLVPVALAVVHFNTIIHPFTLADNRHYMFYIFRYTILRAGWVRYALAPVYVFCGALCWKTLEGCRPNYYKAQDEDCPVVRQTQGRCGFINRPFIGGSIPFPSTQEITRRHLAGLALRWPDHETTPSLAVHDYLDDSHSVSASPPSLSTALLWVLTTALSLITAPLVEPRYFILPWVFWRLLAPAWPAHTCFKPRFEGDRPRNFLGPLGWLFRLGRKVDVRLSLETMWFLVINLFTGYMFIARPFYWRAEDGTLLDGGRVQRFMW
ncbi:Dol-P-Glc:Glc(2)Man(9)GlcNAc(2)-PP-Dol alpha-1,2-glucosyltransferase [Cytospora mali]|uniref:Dol-P-Glc:Glc(2)Man(9)GlcNAc(2)-PP-Dol alpha-1,2-glucosyltransferase n=1 Tax=Cytospora mali TaxID=578113 RepID=A0A194UWC8_CYTMA|nr:Dol-P-Glc:Glc(2)Man(9)GlcNAc(2)-PP-Dol alpha-1,2-glucosyltransferase [Valsa mali var. pyri (nom. inval.)]